MVVTPAKKPDLERLSFAEATVPAIENWAAMLPLVNTEETARQLKQAINELRKLICPPELRFQLLESLRPLVHYICSRLDRTELVDPKLDARRLQRKLANGYETVLRQAEEILEQDEKGVPKDILPSAAHRLLSELSYLALRVYQTYSALPRGYWSLVHRVYLMAEQRNVTEFKLQDTEIAAAQTLTIKDAYLRNLMLATCKPNQLKQTDLANIFNALQMWTAHVSIEADPADGFFSLDLNSNKAPAYTAPKAKAKEPRGFRTQVLAYEIDAYLNDVSSSVPIPDNLSNDLLRHVAAAWSVVHPRNFRRLPMAGSVKVCVGLRAVHYFLSGGVDFNDQVANADIFLHREINPFLDVDYAPLGNNPDDNNDDPWSQAHDLKVKIPENPNVENPDSIIARLENPQPTRKFNHFDLSTVDTSPGGYCVTWGENAPSNVQVGELIALREEHANRWCVAAIRWLTKDKEHTHMGVQLLSPKAIPVAIRPIHKKGGTTGYSRGLLLPGMDAIGQSATIITPKLPFTEQQKVSIQRQGVQSTGMLMDAQVITESFNQFTFRMLDGYLENSPSGSNIDDLMTREDTTQGP